MSLRRKAYGVLVAIWEALVTVWYILAIASFAVVALFLVLFAFGAALELAEKLVAP